MREVAFDTETTGLDPNAGHRVVEFGCVELWNHMPTGRTFHKYCNPERPMPPEAFAVHGLSDEFLAGHPTFGAIAGELVEFIGDSPIIIHNADFDMKFLNWELKNLNLPIIPREQAVDTVSMARKKFPGAPASLKALCQRFSIDDSHRELHGALLDSQLLASVYLELIGGRQPGLELAATAVRGSVSLSVVRTPRAARPHTASPEELAAHEAFLKKLKEPIWLLAD